ncbi:cystatin-B-like [Ctenopharyngodon idella]|uniref:cystatin-B-like n=1 Tax=Ctenopharyngodon idella TaxID=7959 RepID=UPI0022323981|nr:cystatin-B-like [Ctenopharyngodon idella]
MTAVHGTVLTWGGVKKVGRVQRAWPRLPPSDIIKALIKVKPDIEKMARTTFDVYTPVSFAYQALEGEMNYVINVNVGDVCVHAMASEALPHGKKLTVLRIQHPKVLSDPLKPF